MVLMLSVAGITIAVGIAVGEGVLADWDPPGISSLVRSQPARIIANARRTSSVVRVIDETPYWHYAMTDYPIAALSSC